MPVLITTRTRTADLGKPRIILIDRGFAYLFDRFNHHAFQPPLYPVHTSGPETHSILFAFREKLWSRPDSFRAVNSYCGRAVTGHENIFAIGDIARMEGDPNFNAGHPQMAPTAIRQGRQFARNFSRWLSKQGPLPFRYLRIGSMAAVGRNHALVDRVFVFFSWLWGNFSYDQSNRIIISRSCEGI
jgi:hypothetical protein